ncbi:MAG: DUF4491 family protein [Oscillibacter sp.]|nr:DUF4491 family protein [Oscillibacter sp.]
MHLHGILLGLASFLSIGLFHPLVIRCEYQFSYRCWPVFGAAGAVLLFLSTLAPNIIVSAILGVVGFSCMWSILELFQQRWRVDRGWFKANPKYHSTAVPETGSADAHAHGAVRNAGADWNAGTDWTTVQSADGDCQKSVT